MARALADIHVLQMVVCLSTAPAARFVKQGHISVHQPRVADAAKLVWDVDISTAIQQASQLVQ